MRPGHTEADRLTRALRDAQQGNHARAEVELRRILSSNPASVEAQFGLATLLATTGRLPEAITLLRAVVQARPDHPAALVNLGNALLQVGNPGEAGSAYRAALKVKAGSLPALFGLGCVLQHEGRPGEAEACFRSALQLQPDNPGLWMNLGTVLRQQQKLPLAVDAYRRASQLKPDLHQSWAALGQTLLDLNSHREAEQAFLRALAIAPNLAEAQIGLGDALCAQQRDQDALERYLAAIVRAPESQSAHTKVESLLLRRAGASSHKQMFERLVADHIYARPSDAIPEALELLDTYAYPVTSVLDETRTLLHEWDPDQPYPGAWWRQRLTRFGDAGAGHDKVFRGIASAIYSWSPPSREALEAVATFTGDAVLRSFGAGTGYWEWLLAQHFGTRVIAGDRILRHRFIAMAEEDYGTAEVGEGETVFLAWIPQGMDLVMNLLRQIRAGQKLVIVGQGPDASGKARICATDEIFRHIGSAFDPAGQVPLGYYSYITDDVRLYIKR